MADDFKTFDLKVKLFKTKTVPEAVGNLRNAVALEGVRGVVLMSPVDTGRLRANWQVTANAPAEGHDPDLMDKDGAKTVAAGAAVIKGTTDPFAPIWIHNGVPYARYVNDGTKRNRAVRMVERTVARLRRLKYRGRAK